MIRPEYWIARLGRTVIYFANKDEFFRLVKKLNDTTIQYSDFTDIGNYDMYYNISEDEVIAQTRLEDPPNPSIWYRVFPWDSVNHPIGYCQWGYPSW